MFIKKLFYHLNMLLVLLMYRVIYGSRLVIGKGLSIRRNFEVMIDSRGKVIVGNNCFFNNDCTLDSHCLIKIGDGTILGENVKVYDHNHRFRDSKISIKAQGYTLSEIYIGNHCWVGSNVVICKGARIGDNCVIGAGTVVDSNIPDNTIVYSERKMIMKAIKS